MASNDDRFKRLLLATRTLDRGLFTCWLLFSSTLHF